MVFDTIAEVSQVRRAGGPHSVGMPFHGGATLIVGPNGHVRYVIVKSVFGEERLEEQRAFISGPGQRYWRVGTGEVTPRQDALKLVHDMG